MAGPSFLSNLQNAPIPGQQLIDGGVVLAMIKAVISGAEAPLTLASPVLTAFINESQVFNNSLTALANYTLPPATSGTMVVFINSNTGGVINANATLLVNPANPGNGNAADVIIPIASNNPQASLTVPQFAVAILFCAQVGRWKSLFQ